MVAVDKRGAPQKVEMQNKHIVSLQTSTCTVGLLVWKKQITKIDLKQYTLRPRRLHMSCDWRHIVNSKVGSGGVSIYLKSNQILNPSGVRATLWSRLCWLSLFWWAKMSPIRSTQAWQNVVDHGVKQQSWNILKVTLMAKRKVVSSAWISEDG